jgi:hypothetical protein
MIVPEFGKNDANLEHTVMSDRRINIVTKQHRFKLTIDRSVRASTCDNSGTFWASTILYVYSTWHRALQWLTEHWER